MESDSAESRLPFFLALKSLLSIPYSPRNAFRVIASHKSLNLALSLIFVFAAIDVFLDLLYGGHVMRRVTILYLTEVPYSDIAWAFAALTRRLVYISGIVIVAMLIVEIAFKGKKSPRRFVSTIGFYFPWSVLISGLFVAAASPVLFNSSEAYVAILFLVFSMPLIIWMVWLLGTAISVAGDVSISRGIAAAIIAQIFASVVIVGMPDMPTFLIPVAAYLTWRLRRTRRAAYGDSDREEVA